MANRTDYSVAASVSDSFYDFWCFMDMCVYVVLWRLWNGNRNHAFNL